MIEPPKKAPLCYFLGAGTPHAYSQFLHPLQYRSVRVLPHLHLYAHAKPTLRVLNVIFEPVDACTDSGDLLVELFAAMASFS